MQHTKDSRQSENNSNYIKRPSSNTRTYTDRQRVSERESDIQNIGGKCVDALFFALVIEPLSFATNLHIFIVQFHTHTCAIYIGTRVDTYWDREPMICYVIAGAVAAVYFRFFSRSWLLLLLLLLCTFFPFAFMCHISLFTINPQFIQFILRHTIEPISITEQKQ